jgi:hypothetical protein
VRVAAITGLSTEQVAELTKRVTRHLGTSDLARPGGRPCALNLYWSIVLVVHLLRKNPTQDVAAAFLNVSQATVSRRRDLLRPILAAVLEDLAEPARTRIGRYGTALVDGTICPTWD